MEASIQEPNIKQFIKILQCAAKFGDDLCIHANKTSWELAVSNSSKTAYCNFKLEQPFFCRYKATGTAAQQRQGIKCMLLVKSVLNVIGKTTSTTNVKRVDMKIVDPDQNLRVKRRTQGSSAGTEDEEEEEEEHDDNMSLTAKLELKLVCDHGVIKRHSLHLCATEFLRVDVDPASTPSGFTAETGQLKMWLDHFVQPSTTVSAGGQQIGLRGENSLGWMFTDREVRVKTWEGGAGSRELATEIKIDSRDFQYYDILEGRIDFTLPMREFRATLALADQLGIDLTVSFSESTQPLTMMSILVGSEDKDICRIFCAIATTPCEAFKDARVDAGPNRGNANGNNNTTGRDDYRSRSTSIKRNDSDTSASNTKRASSSVPTSGRNKRPSLSFTMEPEHSKGASIVYNSQANSQAGPSQPGGGESLFLPGGSQSGSQRMSQAEALALAGFAGDDTEDLLDAMDDAGDDLDDEEQNVSNANRARNDQAMDVDEEPRRGIEIDQENLRPSSGTNKLFVPEPGIFGDISHEQGGGAEEDELLSDSEEFPSTIEGSNRQFTRLFSD